MVSSRARGCGKQRGRQPPPLCPPPPTPSGRDSLPEDKQGAWILKRWENSKKKSSSRLWEIVNLGEVDGTWDAVSNGHREVLGH